MDINELIISEKATIREAIKKLDDTGKRILIILENELLKAVITDGDIRRWIMKNGNLSNSVKEVANYSPKYITEFEKNKVKDIMREYGVSAIPVVGAKGKLESVIFWDDIELKSRECKANLNIPVVIMAGGLGSRLYPYTKILPKPLIPIGDIPIIERIINKFREYECREYFLTVNYKKNMIRSYFDEIEKNYEIIYVEEEKPLGTGGSLYLLKGKINKTFFVSNCDILIDADYSSIYEYHKNEKNLITIVCAVKNFAIPYGVINIDNNGGISEIIEKPEYSFLANTGFYLLEPEVLDIIEENTFIHLPQIVEKCMKENKKVSVYPITEKSWMDMGQIDEMKEMTSRLEGK
jgi:dTDP-glucose pyrophosphorylase